MDKSLLNIECNSDFFTTSQLKSRGWTKSLIQNFLGEPCLTKPNPHCRTAAPMKMYRKDIVLDIEQLYIFIQQKAELTIQSEKAKQRALANIKNNIDMISTADLRLGEVSVESLLSEARNAINDNINNNIPHKLKNHEKIVAVALLFEKASPSMYVIDTSFGMSGVRAMREVMRTRILESIKVNFPELGDVCHQIKKHVDLGCPELNLDLLAKVNSVN